MAPSTEEIRYLVTDPHSGADRSGNMLQMLHHVALEVRPDQIEPDRRFWVAVGFVEVPAAPELGAGYTWFEREGTQIHLMHADAPAIPARGHVAIVTPAFDQILVRVREVGIEVAEGRQLWGARRAKAKLASGHTVELMAAPPAPHPEAG